MPDECYDCGKKTIPGTWWSLKDKYGRVHKLCNDCYRDKDYDICSGCGFVFDTKYLTISTNEVDAYCTFCLEEDE